DLLCSVISEVTNRPVRKEHYCKSNRKTGPPQDLVRGTVSKFRVGLSKNTSHCNSHTIHENCCWCGHTKNQRLQPPSGFAEIRIDQAEKRQSDERPDSTARLYNRKLHVGQL